MQILINADEVYKTLESYEIKETFGKPLTDWEYGYNCGIERAESEIECAPTVEAIPIEYIESTMNRWKEIIGYEESVDALKILIDKWKAEREEE